MCRLEKTGARSVPPGRGETLRTEQPSPTNHFLRLAGLLLAAALLYGCLALSAPAPTTAPTPVSGSAAGSRDSDPAAPTAEPVPTDTATLAPVRISSPTPRPPAAPSPTPTEDPLALACAAPHPVTTALVAGIEPESWMQWVRRLSGAEPVTIGGEEVVIETRYTPAMFGPDGRGGQPNARAFEYVLQEVSAWYPPEQIEVQDFALSNRAGETIHGKNLILTLPGAALPEEVVILSAHLDSTSRDDPEQRAPGAEDNASGAATLLEAARLFRGVRFERTIRIIWFTGEEQGLLGSRAYVEGLRDPQSIAGVINLDMFGYDSDGDGCFELHVGPLPQSQRIGRCFAAAVNAFAPEIETFDYLTDVAISASDHGSFWDRGIGAVEVLENMFDNQLPGGCPNVDNNPAYHSPEDTHERLNPETAARIARAALASAAGLAGPLE